MMNIDLAKLNLHAPPEKREKIVFAVALLIFFFVFLKSCWGPSRVAISTVKKDLAALMEERGAVVTKDKKVSLWKGSESQRALYVQTAKKISNNSNIVIMKEFSSPVILRDVKMVNISLSDPVIEGNMIRQQWKMSLYGSYISVGTYIERLESLPMLLIVDNINVIASNEALGHVNADIEGIVYGWK